MPSNTNLKVPAVRFENGGYVGTPIIQMRDLPKVQRKVRRPSHRFNLRTRPWQIQPFLIAPVLPGETMTNALMQARVVTDPVSSKLIGWFSEYYFFYCKLTDLDDHASLTSMLVTGASLAGLVSASSVSHYYDGRGVNFTKLCVDRIVDEFFRGDEEAITVATIDSVPLAAIDVDDYTHSLLADSATNETTDELPGENPSLPAHLSAFSDHFAHWEAMRDMGLVDADFEDWLSMMGVKPDAQYEEATRRPELLRYVREWQYPSNTIDPLTGAATSAVSWSIAERLDKKRFFREPGFIVGVTVARPKVYKSTIESAGAHYLDIPYTWLPAVLRDSPFTSLRKFTDTQGPLAGVMTAAYWLDMNDLYQRGDQFVNYAIAGVDNEVTLPTVGFQNDYGDATMADTFFSGANKLIRQDGVCNLRFLSPHSTGDHTPRS